MNDTNTKNEQIDYKAAAVKRMDEAVKLFGFETSDALIAHYTAEAKRGSYKDIKVHAMMAGARAFKDGIKCIPAMDIVMDAFIKGLSRAGREHSKRLIHVMKLWQYSWTIENLKD